MRLMAKKVKELPSQRNTHTVKNLILKAARVRFKTRKGLHAFFEHGHWWLRVQKFDRHGVEDVETYDVVDAEGPGSIYGFDFEEV